MATPAEPNREPGRADEPHPDVQTLLEILESMGNRSLANGTPEEARQVFDAMLTGGDPVVELPSVEDRTIDGPGGELPIRVYEPRSDPGAGGADPLICYFHGGGFVIGNLDTHDDSCRKLAEETGYPVVSVDYRLAPEHPFPEPLRDCYAALEWAAGAADSLDADPDRIVLAGDSAGGNLATTTALLSRDRGGPDVAYQLLIYPVTGDATETAAYEENAEGYFLTKDDMDWFDGHYLPDDIDERNGYAAPRQLLDLSGLPPATVLTAGFDPLRDDGALYADRLEDCGVPVTYRNYDDLIHGFFGMISEPIDVDRAHEAYAAAVEDLKAELE